MMTMTKANSTLSDIRSTFDGTTCQLSPIDDIIQEFYGNKTDLNVESQSAEDFMLRVLSVLATKHFTREEASTHDIWKQLTNVSDNSQRISAGNNNEWDNALSFLGELIPNMTPFEIHSTAIQSITFHEGPHSIAYVSLCILLCCVALQRCPTPISARHKRWQSCLFETIHAFQRNCMDPAYALLWTEYVVPSVCYLHTVFENSNVHTIPKMAWTAALVSTCAHFAVIIADCVYFDEFQKHIESFVDSLGSSLGSLDIVWSHPRRAQFFEDHGTGVHTEPSSTLSDEDSLVYWTLQGDDDGTTTTLDRKDRINQVDTTWNINGIALMGAVAYKHRPMVYSPQHLWWLWFPHVTILLNNDSCLVHQQLGFSLLHSLLRSMPHYGLKLYRCKVDDPVGTFQLLFNRLLNAKSQVTTALPDGVTTYREIKSLLAVYSPQIQVCIVQQLLQNCPFEGLASKILDLLRPFVHWEDEFAVDQVWNLISEYVDRLVSQIARLPMATDEMLGDVELYSSVLSLLRLWLLLKGTLPKLSRYDLIKSADHLSTTIKLWERCPSDAPDVYHPLLLLESSLHDIISILDVTRFE